MSLADELLADLEEGGDDAERDMAGSYAMAEVEDVNMDVSSLKSYSIRSVAKLSDSEELKDVIESIEHFSKQTGKREVLGPVEADPEYQVIVAANNIVAEVDNELNVIHKFVRDVYNKRFPELESLIPVSIEYLKTVKELGNDVDKTKNNEVLQQFLTPATIMVVSVTASTTQGSELTSEELNSVTEACDMAVELLDRRHQILTYVESRMSFIAPNLSIIVGASTAAKLMGVAGGLTLLSKMPACNILLLGAQKRTLSGFSSTAIMPHTGFIYFSEIVQKTPPDLRKKAARLISAKCTLAARVDSFHESTNGRVGDRLRAEIEQKLDKLQEPPPVKTIKPLPAPIEVARKKRGGRRHRKMKERLGITEIRKAQNRMVFGEIEEDAYQEDLGMSLGTLGKSKSGRVRGPLVDSKTKAKISKTLQQRMTKQQQVWGGSTTVKKQVAGTASSVAFTPLQGLEIVNPQAAEKKVEEANQKYFSSTASFLKVKKS